MLALIFILSCIFHCGSGGLSSYPTLTIDPMVLDFGFNPTGNLTVVCSFPPDEIVLSKLSLERRVKKGVNKLLVRASFGDSSPTVSAHFNSSAMPDAYFAGSGSPVNVSFTLENPSQGELGRYACRPESSDADIDKFLQPIYYDLHSQDLNMVRLNQELSILESGLQNLSDTLDGVNPIPQINYSIPIAELNDRLDNLTEAVETAGNGLSFVEGLSARSECLANMTLETVENLDTAIYLRSNEFNNASHYLLSQYVAITFLTAQRNCEAHGGYLAEIDTEEEFNFITDFLNDITSDQQVVLFGAIWEGGQFVNRRDRQPIGYSNYFFAEPDGSMASDACLALYKQFFVVPGIKMEGTYCDDIPAGPFDFTQSILCEIPVGASFAPVDCGTG